mmetsp:Transcript_15139/g.22263  ORF Transcript_15139/g.22263 Transcript_15139/m.22263 type:complete len:184 (-) Transcript_15139:219-770(-)
MVEHGSARVLEAEAAHLQAIETMKTGANLGETTGMAALTIDAHTMKKKLSALLLAANTMMRMKVDVTVMNALERTGRTATKEATRSTRRMSGIPVMTTTATEMGTRTETYLSHDKRSKAKMERTIPLQPERRYRLTCLSPSSQIRETCPAQLPFPRIPLALASKGSPQGTSAFHLVVFLFFLV